MFFPSIAFAQEADVDKSSVAVVELYTSIGCIQCAVASSALRTLVNDAKKEHKKVLALSFHTDYSKSTGLDDAFSRKEFVERQQMYAKHFKRNKLSVPETVINGSQILSSMEFRKVRNAVDAALASPTRIIVRLNKNKNPNSDTLDIRYSVSGMPKSRRMLAYLHLAVVKKRLDQDLVDVDGRELQFKHTNIVLSLETKRITADTEADFQFVIPSRMQPSEIGVVGILQDSRSLNILGGDEL